jgi:hypothetical protein
VVIVFTIGKYSDKVMCDVVPHASHFFWGIHGNSIGRQFMMVSK